MYMSINLHLKVKMPKQKKDAVYTQTLTTDDIIDLTGRSSPKVTAAPVPCIPLLYEHSHRPGSLHPHHFY